MHTDQQCVFVLFAIIHFNRCQKIKGTNLTQCEVTISMHIFSIWPVSVITKGPRQTLTRAESEICDQPALNYEVHLESSGNSEIFQSQKQDPVHFSYQCKGLYLFFQMTILSTYFITSVQRYRPLLRCTVCIVKFSTFTTIFNNFDIPKIPFIQIDHRKQICLSSP